MLVVGKLGQGMRELTGIQNSFAQTFYRHKPSFKSLLTQACHDL